MDVAFRVEAQQEALARFGRPEVFNTDQGEAAQGCACVSTWNGCGGSQLTSADFTDVPRKAQVRISMDAAGGGWTTCSSSGCGAA